MLVDKLNIYGALAIAWESIPIPIATPTPMPAPLLPIMFNHAGKQCCTRPIIKSEPRALRRSAFLLSSGTVQSSVPNGSGAL